MGSKSEPKVIPRSRHGIGRDALSASARKVCEGLQQAGFSAYVVGGAVRDVLLGVRPKDYDVATDASPEQVHKLFRRSRLIGRRFKLVHVMFGDETIEVSTFRARDIGNNNTDEHGRVLRDNLYGTREDDALRRDFTVNALYYDPSDETIVDFCGGMQDVKKKTVRIIGDARERFREDPIRMLRAVRFAAKLGFSIDEQTRAPIASMADLIGNVPPARVFDEMMKLLLSGHAAETVKRLRKEGLHHGLLPMLDVILEQPLGERFVMLALAQTDQRVLEGKPVSPAFLFASLLWHEVLAAWAGEQKKGERPIPGLFTAMDTVTEVQTEKLAIPRRFTAVMKDIWVQQPRFEQRSGRRPYALLAQEKFRAGYDFLALRAASGEVEQELADWWERFQRVGDDERQAMLVEPTQGEPKARTRRRRRRKPDGGATTKPVTE
jgi:poly(A) polymerase